MKKKIYVIGIISLLVFNLTGCSNESVGSSSYNSKNEYVYSNTETETSHDGKEKVECSMCNGTGLVKYYYGDSAWDAALNGHDDYEYGTCSSCDGTGYIYITPIEDNESSSNSTSSFSTSTSDSKKTCPSCGRKVDSLKTKTDAAGVSRTWCSKCWSDYDAIMGR